MFRSAYSKRLFFGLLLVSTCWPLTWLLPGSRSHALFFPLWLGYALVVDALVARRRGSSLFSRSPRGFAGLFVASVPIWWLFELLNRRVGNWEYLGTQTLSDTEYFLWASLSFSTVVPSVLGTAELVASFHSRDRFGRARRTVRTPIRWGLALSGAAMCAALLVWPSVFYPFLWIFPLFLLDPLAHAWGRPSVLGFIERGALGPVVFLALGALICGFFWELWNFYSYPKWIYHVPGFEFGHIFEMPALGYLGYLPFGVSLYTLTHLLIGRTTVEL